MGVILPHVTLGWEDDETLLSCPCDVNCPRHDLNVPSLRSMKSLPMRKVILSPQLTLSLE